MFGCGILEAVRTTPISRSCLVCVGSFVGALIEPHGTSKSLMSTSCLPPNKDEFERH